MKIVLHGVPISKQRARSFLMGSKISLYDPQKKQIALVRAQMLSQIKKMFDSDDKSTVMDASGVLYAEAVCVKMKFLFPYPAFKNRRQKNRIFWGIQSFTQKPDVDNLAKFYLDCANGLLFTDDRQVVELYVKKSFNSQPKTILEIMPTRKKSLTQSAVDVLEMMDPSEMLELARISQELLEISTSHIAKCNDENDDDDDDDIVRAANMLISMSEKYLKIFSKIAPLYPLKQDFSDE